MNIFKRYLTFTVLAVAIQSHLVMGAERVALLVGVSDYENVVPLENTLNDVKLIATSLEKLDFDVFQLNNPTQNEFREALSEFEFKSETAEVSLIYYAGHGIEISGKNYILPVDSKAEDFSAATISSISLDELLVSVDKARQMRIVILDSCRDNPFVTDIANSGLSLPNTSATGLAEPSPDKGTLVAFAAKDGARALDSLGDGAINSPYATALSNQMNTKNLEIGLLFRKVRDSVLRLTGGVQEPHTYGSLTGTPFFLAGRNQDVNGLEDTDRQFAWNRLGVEEEQILERSASDGDLRSILGLAYMRLDPESERYDPAQAVELLAQAADLGEPEAMFELGGLYERGIGTDQNVEQAVALYERAASLNFADAINDLGFLNYQGGLGIERNQQKALAFFERAADLGHPEAMFNFAALIDDGEVEDRTNEDAAQYLYSALRSGDEAVLTQLTEDPNMFKLKTRQALQRALTETEFYQGKIDGSFGPQTNRGLRQAFGLTD